MSDCPWAWSLPCSQVARVWGPTPMVCSCCMIRLSPTMSCHREAPGGDRVAQKYVHQPVLWQGRKFDLRLYILVSIILTSGSPLGATVMGGSRQLLGAA